MRLRGCVCNKVQTMRLRGCVCNKVADNEAKGLRVYKCKTNKRATDCFTFQIPG